MAAVGKPVEPVARYSPHPLPELGPASEKPEGQLDYVLSLLQAVVEGRRLPPVALATHGGAGDVLSDQNEPGLHPLMMPLDSAPDARFAEIQKHIETLALRLWASEDARSANGGDISPGMLRSHTPSLENMVLHTRPDVLKKTTPLGVQAPDSPLDLRGDMVDDASESGLSAEEELHLLKAQVRDIARVCKAVALGDLTQHIMVPVQGSVMVELKEIINQMVDRLGNFASEVTRVSLEVGTQGRLGGQAFVPGVEGTWKELKDVVNRLAENLTNQVRGVALVTKAVARGDLSKKIDVQADGEILELKVTINVMAVSYTHLTLPTICSV